MVLVLLTSLNCCMSTLPSRILRSSSSDTPRMLEIQQYKPAQDSWLSHLLMLWTPHLEFTPTTETLDTAQPCHQGRQKGEIEQLLFCRRSVWADFPISTFLCRLCMQSSLVGLVTSLRGADFWSCVSSAKSWWPVYRVVSYDIGERRSVQDEENGRQYWALRHTLHELWWCTGRVIDWSGLISVWEVWLKPLECSRLNAKYRVQAGEENLVVNSVKSGGKIQQKIQQKKNRNSVVIVQSGENIVYNT